MKKIIAIALCMIMTLSIVLTLVACEGNDAPSTDTTSVEESTESKADEKEESKEEPSVQESKAETDEEKLVGTWETDFNFGKLLTGMLSGLIAEYFGGADFGYYEDNINVFDAYIKEQYIFTADGKGTRIVDKADYDALSEKVVEECMRWSEGFAAYCIETKEVEMTVEEFLIQFEINEDSFKEIINYENIIGEENQEFEFTVKDGVITMEDEEGAVSYNYKLEGDSFILETEVIDPDDIDEETAELLKEIYPLTYKKVG